MLAVLKKKERAGGLTASIVKWRARVTASTCVKDCGMIEAPEDLAIALLILAIAFYIIDKYFNDDDPWSY